MRDIYVLGFPKSGNTWLSNLLRSAGCNAQTNHPKPSGLGFDLKSSICIVRDVRDVIVSYMFYLHLMQFKQKFELSIDRGLVNKFIKTIQNKGIIGSNVKWTEYIHDALSINGLKMIRYEDLWFKTKETFQIVLDRLKIKVDDVDSIIEKNNFENSKIRYKKEKDEFLFASLRKGVPGQYKEYMNGEQIERCNDLFGKELQILGYTL